MLLPMDFDVFQRKLEEIPRSANRDSLKQSLFKFWQYILLVGEDTPDPEKVHRAIYRLFPQFNAEINTPSLDDPFLNAQSPGITPEDGFNCRNWQREYVGTAC